VSSHPLAKVAPILERYSTVSVADLAELHEGQEVVVGGFVTAVKHHTTSRGDRMAFVTLETLTGPCEITVFADVFAKCAGLLVQDMVVMIPGRVSMRNDEAGLIASDVVRIEDVEQRLTKAVHIRLSTVGLDSVLLEELATILGERPGRCDVYLHCCTPERDEITVHATSACRVAPTEELRREVTRLLGEDCLWFSGGNGLTQHEY